MKIKLKKGLVSIFLSCLLGGILGRIVFNVYDNNNEVIGNKIYLISVGEYDNYDSMIKNTSYNKYIYYEDDGIFNMVIGYTEDKDNIDKIKSVYDGDVNVYEYYSKDKEFNNKVREYDLKIKNSSNNEEIKNIVLEMIGLYKNGKNTLTDFKY